MKHYVRRTLAILLAVMLLAALSIPAYAQGPRGNGQERGNGKPCAFHVTRHRR